MGKLPMDRQLGLSVGLGSIGQDLLERIRRDSEFANKGTVVTGNEQKARSESGGEDAHRDGRRSAILGVDKADCDEHAGSFNQEASPFQQADFRAADQDALASRIERNFDGLSHLALGDLLAWRCRGEVESQLQSFGEVPRGHTDRSIAMG